jgi:hypothetical protein
MIYEASNIFWGVDSGAVTPSNPTSLSRIILNTDFEFAVAGLDLVSVLGVNFLVVT